MANNDYFSKMGEKLGDKLDNLKSKTEDAVKNFDKDKFISDAKNTVNNITDGVQNKVNSVYDKAVGDDKYCICCGKKLGPFGNRKLADGTICNKCYLKFEPYIKSDNISLPSITYDYLSFHYDRWKEEQDAKNKKILKIVLIASISLLALSTLLILIGTKNEKQESNETVISNISPTPEITKEPTIEPTIEVSVEPTKEAEVIENTKPKEEANSSIEEKSDTSTSSNSVFYSTNSKDTVKNGNSGVYAYKDKNTNYHNYWIVDFDQGYVYRFIDDDSISMDCDKLKIESGNLNEYVLFAYHLSEGTFYNALNFKYVNNPEHLILQDEDGYDWDFYPTDLSDARRIMSRKTIIEY